MTARVAGKASAKLYALWALAALFVIAFQLLANAFSGEESTGGALPFAIVVTIAMLFGAIGATKLIVRAHRTFEIELAYYGLFFLAQSALTVSYAISTTDVFANNTTATDVWFWATPIGLIAASPALFHRSTVGRAIDAEWKHWVTTLQVTIIAFAIMLILFPGILPSVPTGNTLRIIVLVNVIGCLALSARHVFLAIVAQSVGPLVVACSIVAIGASNLVWLDMAELSASFWVSHFTMLFGVIIGTVSALGVYQITSHVRQFIDSIVAADPRCALEVGMEPSIHTFVADLETEPVRVEHVLRTRDLAMAVGAKLGSSGVDLRNIGLTALLHDIGMMLIPAAIVDTPGPLSDEHYEIVKRHAIYGARILEESPVLKPIASAVAAHHERIDGKGYPHGLAGPNIPPHARLVSVCDAFDALSNHRHYRRSLDFEEAIEVLERSAGSQWDRRVVEYVVRTVRHQPVREMPKRLDSQLPIGCDCMPRMEAS